MPALKSTVSFGAITAQNPAFNATWVEGQKLKKMVADQHLSADPRIYANGWNMFYPETNEQDNSDLPEWVVLTGPSLVDWGLPGSGAKVYLQLWVQEKQNFFCVAQVLKSVASGTPLDQALS